MFEKHVIDDGSWTVEIAPGYGANVTRLQYCKNDVLVPLVSEKQLDENPYIQGSPILLPANRTANGKFLFDGREYTLPVTEPATGANLHGILHRQSFDVIFNSANEIRLRYINTGAVFPFPFEIIAEYCIKDNRFEQKYAVTNIGETAMPFTFALHTSFIEPDTFSVPIDLCQERDSANIPTGRYVPLSMQEKRYVTGSASKNIEISGYYRACGRQAVVGDYTYTASEEFDHWILFNGRGKKGLLCVEPQCGRVNGLNIDGGCVRLEPGKKITLHTGIEKTGNRL